MLPSSVVNQTMGSCYGPLTWPFRPIYTYVYISRYTDTCYMYACMHIGYIHACVYTYILADNHPMPGNAIPYPDYTQNDGPHFR